MANFLLAECDEWRQKAFQKESRKSESNVNSLKIRWFSDLQKTVGFRQHSNSNSNTSLSCEYRPIIAQAPLHNLLSAQSNCVALADHVIQQISYSSMSSVTTFQALSSSLTFPWLFTALIFTLCYRRHAYIIVSTTGTLIDSIVVCRPTWHKIGHFGDDPQANLLAWYRKTKPNTTKARIHQSKEMYYNTKWKKN